MNDEEYDIPKPRWVKDLETPVPTHAIYLTPQAIKALKYVLSGVTEYESLTLSEAVEKFVDEYIKLDNYRMKQEQPTEKGIIPDEVGYTTDAGNLRKPYRCENSNLHKGHRVTSLRRWCIGDESWTSGSQAEFEEREESDQSLQTGVTHLNLSHVAVLEGGLPEDYDSNEVFEMPLWPEPMGFQIPYQDNDMGDDDRG